METGVSFHLDGKGGVKVDKDGAGLLEVLPFRLSHVFSFVQKRKCLRTCKRAFCFHGAQTEI